MSAPALDFPEMSRWSCRRKRRYLETLPAHHYTRAGGSSTGEKYDIGAERIWPLAAVQHAADYWAEGKRAIDYAWLTRRRYGPVLALWRIMNWMRREMLATARARKTARLRLEKKRGRVAYL